MQERLVYLDTNILSRIPDPQVPEQTAHALAKLTRLGGIKFVTSDKSKQEILKTPNQQRNSLLQFLHALINKVPLYTVHYSGALGMAPLNATPVGGDWTDPTYAKLTRIFEPDDAEHIVQALRAGCDYFMTLDVKTILNRVRANLAEVQEISGPMRFVAPEELVSLMENERKLP